MAGETALAESAQAIFCSMADKIGRTNVSKILDLKKYETFDDFIREKKNQKLWKESLVRVDIDVPSGEVDKFLRNKIKWYQSSVIIAIELVKELANKIDPDFKIAAANYQRMFYFRGDDNIMQPISKLYTLANKSPVTKQLKNHVQFRDINKWSPADIYLATEKAEKKLKKELRDNDTTQGQKSYSFTDLNTLISDLIDSGELLPLSLKKTTRSVDLYKINFDRSTELNILKKIKMKGYSDWKKYKKVDWLKVKKGAKTETRDIRLFLSIGGEIKFRHDPSATRFVAEFIGGGAEARGGSIASHEIITELWSYVDSIAASKFLTAYNKGDKLFRSKLAKIAKHEKKWKLDKKDAKLNKWIHERGTISALEIINGVMPIMQAWVRDADQKKLDKFVRLMYEYATSRTSLSGKFVIAK